MTNAKRAKQQRTAAQKPSGGGSKKAPPPRAKAKGRKGGKRSASGLWVWLGVGLFALVIAALAFTGSSGSGPSPEGSVSIDAEPRTEPIPTGSPIPEWSAPALEGDGATITWSEQVGAPTVLAVWAPWCPHCQVELPRLAEAVDARPEIELVSITTALNQGGPSPDEYMDDENLTFPVGVDDAAGTLAAGLGVVSFPTTYYVDSSGNVVTVTTGEVEEEQLAAILDQLAQT